MKITKGQLKQIIAEEAEKSLTVDAVIAEIAPEVEEMSMAELQLLSMKLDNLIAQLSGRGAEVEMVESRLKEIIAEKLSKLHEAAPDLMGTPRGDQTDYVADAPEGETQWRETGFQATDYSDQEPVTYVDRTGGAWMPPKDHHSHDRQASAKAAIAGGQKLAAMSNVGPESFAQWAKDHPNRYHLSGEHTQGSKATQGTGQEPQESSFATDRLAAYSHRGAGIGELITPQVGYFGGDINAPESMKPRFGVQSYAQETSGDYGRPGQLQPGQQLAVTDRGDTITAPQRGDFNVSGLYDLGQTGRARQRSEQRFEKGVDMYGNPLEESVKIKVPYRKPDIGEEEPEMSAKPSELYKKSRAAATFKSQSMQEQQQPVDYTRHVGNRFQASADGYTERLFLGKKPYEIEVTESGFKVVSAPAGYEKYVGREFTSPGTEGHDNKFWSVAMRELGQAAGREGGIYAPPVPEPVTPEVPPVIDPGPVLAAGDEEESMGESQDVFKRLCEIALKPYGSVLK